MQCHYNPGWCNGQTQVSQWIATESGFVQQASSVFVRDSKSETISSQLITTVQRCAHMTRASPYHITDTVMPTIRQAPEQLDVRVTITNSQGTICGVYGKGTEDMR